MELYSLFACPEQKFIEKRKKAQAEKEPPRQYSAVHMLVLCLSLCATMNVAVILLLFPDARAVLLPFLKVDSTDDMVSLAPTQEELLSWSTSLYAILHGIGEDV